MICFSFQLTVFCNHNQIYSAYALNVISQNNFRNKCIAFLHAQSKCIKV